MAPFEGITSGRGEKEDPKDHENLRAHDEAVVVSGHHSENLYDQNEDAAGERIDLRTGLPFVNDADGAEATAHQMHAVEHGSTDALPDLLEPEDDAARWLRENGG